MKTKIMFDTNAYDKLQNNIPTLKHTLQKYDFYVSSIQITEILAIPDEKKDIRNNNLRNLIELRPTLVPTPFTFDHLNFSSFSFSPEPSYWHILKESKANRNDALIAATAIHEDCRLVTDDKDLLRRMKLLEKPA